MAVSDPSGRNWDGTTIHENLSRVKNTCGNEGTNACSNRGGEGGGAGSAFRVGAASNFLGLAPLAAVRNQFYDVHAFAHRGSSLLHQLNRNDCEVQCEQTYAVAGRGSDLYS
jgi:hypothetical protein